MYAWRGGVGGCGGGEQGCGEGGRAGEVEEGERGVADGGAGDGVVGWGGALRSGRLISRIGLPRLDIVGLKAESEPFSLFIQFSKHGRAPARPKHPPERPSPFKSLAPSALMHCLLHQLFPLGLQNSRSEIVAGSTIGCLTPRHVTVATVASERL